MGRLDGQTWYDKSRAKTHFIELGLDCTAMGLGLALSCGTAHSFIMYMGALWAG